MLIATFLVAGLNISVCEGEVVWGKCAAVEKSTKIRLAENEESGPSRNATAREEKPPQPPEEEKDKPSPKEIKTEVKIFCDYGYVTGPEGAEVFVRLDSRNLRGEIKNSFFGFVIKECGGKGTVSIRKEGYLAKALSFNLPPCECKRGSMKEDITVLQEREEEVVDIATEEAFEEELCILCPEGPVAQPG